MQHFPKWATPQRRAWLALQLATTLATDMDGFEVDLLTGKITHPKFEKVQETARYEWVANDREERYYLLRLEQESLHPREHMRQGAFDSIARDIFLESQPSHYTEGFTVNPLTVQPVALVRIASSPVRLWVGLPSKNAIHKARRYGKGRLAAIEQAVSDYLKS